MKNKRSIWFDPFNSATVITFIYVWVGFSIAKLFYFTNAVDWP